MCCWRRSTKLNLTKIRDAQSFDRYSRSECASARAYVLPTLVGTTQSSRVLSDNTNHALRDGIAERRRQRSHQAPGGNLCCMENTLVSIGGVLPRSWVRHFVAHTCRPWPQPARHLYQLFKIRSADPQSLSLGCTVHRESCRAGQSS